MKANPWKTKDGIYMKRILVVDDNIAILKQVQTYLADEYEVFLAKSGDLALQIFEKEKPDLIILDIEMPYMNGFVLLSLLKQKPYIKRIPVIFLTANKNKDIHIQALKAGARDFIVKPVEKNILLHRIKLHISFYSYQAQAEQNVISLSDSIATSFAELIECRDENTGNHVVRTSKYVEILGNYLINQGIFTNELNTPELDLMVRGSLLHDIGKIAISDKILLKKDRLNEMEFSVMKRHTELGGLIIKKMYIRMPAQHYLGYAFFIANYHHERYDGKGYPQGLEGEKIPLCGRIMAVADVYDAVTDNRVYRKGMGHDNARDIIYSGEKTHFDPFVVQAFKKTEDQIVEISKKYSNKIYI